MEENQNVQILDSAEQLHKEASLSLILKAEIDTQIATAKAFPRSYKKFRDQTLSIATISENVADSCTFALPRGNKILNGPSVRLAEICVGAFGNLRAGMRVIRNDGRKITAQGICHDLESNSCVTLEVERSVLQHEKVWDQATGKMKNTGRMIPMNEDMQIVTGNAACAIAFRNAIFKVIPSALIQDIHEEVRRVAKGTVETLPARREKALKYLHDLGVKDEQICQALQIKSVEDINLETLATLRGMCTMIRNEEETVANLFPPIVGKAKADKVSKETEAAIKAAAENKKTTPDTPGEAK